MRYGIIGSRARTDKNNIIDLVNSLTTSDMIVSGGCSGPDTWAEEAARKKGIDVKVFLPDLPINKKSPRYKFEKIDAFYARNRLIVENSDVVHAFVSPDRKGGTEYTIKYAQKMKIPVVVHP
jgi:predicted Rossmann fold nucleotide-binding protein DprA/Smf involved in DNA uptake